MTFFIQLVSAGKKVEKAGSKKKKKKSRQAGATIIVVNITIVTHYQWWTMQPIDWLSDVAVVMIKTVTTMMTMMIMSDTRGFVLLDHCWKFWATIVRCFSIKDAEKEPPQKKRLPLLFDVIVFGGSRRVTKEDLILKPAQRLKFLLTTKQCFCFSLNVFLRSFFVAQFCLWKTVQWQ